MQADNAMRRIKVEKVTVNMGVGANPEEMKAGLKIAEKITGRKPVQTLCRVRQPKWDIRPGLPIGIKVTLRKQPAIEFLKMALAAKGNRLDKGNFDNNGNFGFGIKEYIDMPSIRYDPGMGVRGFDVLVTLQRNGFRVKRRKKLNRKVGRKHVITKEEAMLFAGDQLGVVFE
ncbi:MAG: 50S ribosomal protein L5 [Candidatus Diapherotrites archaeon]|nr:50S ribosomal protein L5 [Candidatus Diapherotrites archaeon]